MNQWGNRNIKQGRSGEFQDHANHDHDHDATAEFGSDTGDDDDDDDDDDDSEEGWGIDVYPKISTTARMSTSMRNKARTQIGPKGK